MRLLWATLLGLFIFDTLPNIYTAVGAIIIIAASLYSVHRERVKAASIIRGPHGRGNTNI
ncbi:MAG: EamA/RhaT family transporter, partial [Pseudomonadota bacterium]